MSRRFLPTPMSGNLNQLHNFVSREALFGLLPLFAALLIAVTWAHFDQQHAWQQTSAALNALGHFEFIVLAAKLLLASLPLLAAHYVCFHKGLSVTKKQKVGLWVLAFGLYPLVSIIFSAQVENLNGLLIQQEGWQLLIGASLFSLLIQTGWHTKTHWQFKSLMTLDSTVCVIAVLWASFIAGIFINDPDPMRNQPLHPVLDIALILEELPRFLGYWLQFTIIALCCALIYFINRYLLVRRLLAEQGVFVFLCGAIVTIVLLTPLLAQVILSMPINVPEKTLLPSEDHNPFAPINFQVVFWLLVFSSPIILAFERQQQSQRMAELTHEQTNTELKLLQQQINPHFLFNTLNNLYALTLTQSDKAPGMVLTLSELLRYTVYEGQKSLVPLSQDVTYLINYIKLHKMRLTEDVIIETDITEETKGWDLPPLLLIMLVENAIKHGVEQRMGSAHVKIKLSIQNGILHFRVTNTFTENNKIAGVGNQNLVRRLALLQRDHAKFKSEPIKSGLWLSELTIKLTPNHE